MVLNTYYDKLMNDKKLTIRLLSKYNKLKPTVDLSVPQEVLRFPLTEMMNCNISHNYSGLKPGVSGIFYSIKNAFQQGFAMYEGSKVEYNKILDAIQANVNEYLTGNEYDSRLEDKSSRGNILIPHQIRISDYFKSFDGTIVQIPLTFSIKLFAYNKKTNGISKYVTADEQIENAMNYFVGPKVSNGSVKNTIRMASYGAPNGFQEFKSYTGGMSQDGFCVRFGRYLDISRMLITDVNFSPSKEFIITNGIQSRLYYNLSFTLRPIYAITVLDIMKMFNISSIVGKNGSDISNDLTSIRSVGSMDSL